MKSKASVWLFVVAGILWLLVGLRDLFAPGFFSFSGRVVAGSNIVLEFAVAAVFLVIAGYTANRMRHLNLSGK